MRTGRTTALRQFARLETIGLWRPAPEEQRREVVVSFGEATVMIADMAGRPLTHWSLPAVTRLNPGEMPALYAPDGGTDPDTVETLEIEDETMIAALEKVRRAIDGTRPHPGFLRRGGSGLVLAALALVAVFWLPEALKRQTLSLVPDSTRQEIGATLLGLMQRETGPACRAEAGVGALDRMSARLFGSEARMSIVVLPGAMAAPVLLPGNIIALPRAAIASTDDPFVLAGDILSALAVHGDGDPLRPTLDAAGLRATLSLLATSRLPAAALEPLAPALIDKAPPLPGPEVLAQTFAASGLSLGPWARARHPEQAALIAADPLAGEEAMPVISDADWISLQAICAR